ncbi:MAG TPA: cysteine hydrolase [Candidatus Binataceae bacterium]|jgi:biuret amidohydrolase|nr:cysteine hydrolase [Candidatus Binataceae bacterium]
MARNDHKIAYPIDTATTALVSVDYQVGFGRDAWEAVPHADAAVRNFVRAAQAWREIGGTVIHVHVALTPERGPTGRMTDFVPDAARALGEDSPATVFYDGVVRDGDILVRKTTFGAVISSDLLAQLQSRHFDTAVVSGLTTPICVQTTVDGLSMSGIKVVLLEDACASQAIGQFSAEQAHLAAVERMGYLFAQIETTAGFIASAKAANRHVRAAS